MPDRDHDLVSRLDAMGERAVVDVPSMPAALAVAVAANGSSRALHQPVPRAALAAAAAVVFAGAALVVLRAPSVVRAVPPVGLSGSATLLAMTERFNRGGSIDAALEPLPAKGVHGPSALAAPVYRALDARTGQLPE